MTVETVKEHLERQCVHIENCNCNRGVLVNEAPEGDTEFIIQPRIVQITRDNSTNIPRHLHFTEVAGYARKAKLKVWDSGEQNGGE